jgi:PAS domain S-box-containing protein
VTASAEDVATAGMNTPPELLRLAGPLLDALVRSGLSLVATDARQPDNPIVFINAAFTRLTGYAPADVVGRNCRLMQDTRTDQQTILRISEALKLGQPVDAELLNRRKDGSAFWNRLVIVPIPDGSGAPAFFVGTQTDVTAAREALAVQAALSSRDHALKEVTGQLQATLSTVGILASWDWHIADRRLFGDARFAALYKLPPGEAERGVPPATFFTIIHPQDLARIRLAVGGILHGAEVFSKEYRILLPDGTARWVHARGRRLVEQPDHQARFTGVLVDITAQKRVEERLRIAQSAGGVGTFEYVSGFGTVSVSTQFCELLGLLPSPDLPVRRLNALVHPGDPPIIDLASAETGRVGQVEFRITRPDTGEQRWLIRQGEYLRDNDTSDLRYIGVIYDVTQAKRTEYALRDLNEQLEARVAERTADRNRLWRLSTDVMLVARFDGTINAVNPAWTSLLGWTEEELVGQSFLGLVHPDDQASTIAELGRLSTGATTFQFENRYRARDGRHHWLSWTAVPAVDLIHAVGRDITAEKAREAELEAAQEALRQSQKMEAIGQLTGGVAHDFNNLLTIIRSSTDLLRRPDLAEERRRRYVDAISDTVDRASKLTGQLLAFARRQALKPEVFDVPERVKALGDMLHTVLGSRIQIVMQFECEHCMAKADVTQFDTALVNIAVNARDAMAGEGLLKIGVRQLRRETEASRPSTDSDSDSGSGEDLIAISLSDTGSGIAPGELPHIFEPFFTTKEIGKGTGLGLSQVYGFSKQSRGDVDVRSEVGRGTTFTLYLPRVHDAAAKEEGAGGRVQADTGGGRRVLVVEDNLQVGRFSTQILQDLGYETSWAVNADEALTLLEQADFDVVFSDVVMPGMSGLELGRRIRDRHPRLPVILTSGYSHVLAAEGHDGFELLQKPYAVEELSRVLQKVSLRRN